MKKEIIMQSIRLSFVCLLTLSISYPVFLWLFGRFVPEKAEGSPVFQNNAIVGYQNIGQSFTEEKYFTGRPSEVGFNTGKSGGSNLGFSNPDLLEKISARIRNLLREYPGLKTSSIPIDMITSSGSGLDPHISYEGAIMQVPRISGIRNINPDSIMNLINKVKEEPLCGIFGPIKVNVLKLNLALDNLK